MTIILIILITCVIHQQGVVTVEHSIGPSFLSTGNTKQKLYYNNLGIRLDCLARGNPLPMVNWFRINSTDDRLLIPIQTSELLDLYENGSLFIRPFREYSKPIHAGLFICKAENPVGSIRSIPIQLKPQIYDAYEIEVKNPYGFIQSSVIISCEISPPIASSYVNIIGWLEKTDHQTIQLDLQPKTKYNLLPNENLIIHNLTKDDDHQNYACIIRNHIDNHTKQSRFKTLRVRDRSPFEPELSVPNNTEYQGHAGDLIELPCGIASIPINARISWWKDGFEVNDVGNKIYQNSLILQLSPDDSGIYTCQVDDESIGRMTSMLSLRVNQPIQCKLVLPQTNIPAGSNSELFCTMNSIQTSPIHWQWYHNSRLLSSKLNRYSIINATRKQMGMYQCCSDSMGCCAQTQIRITNSPPFVLPYDQTHLHSIIISPKSIAYVSIDLNCTVYGDPIPEINIYKDGRQLFPENPIEYLPSGDVFLHHVISISTINDTGLYECRARNTFGSVTLSKHINIENQKPFIQPLRNQTIRMEQEFTLHCYASGQPNLHLQWIDQSNQQILNTSSTSPILLTLKTSQSNVYTCQARNSYGEVSSQIVLTVENPARILSITSNRTIQNNERLNIHCSVEGDYPLEVILQTPSTEKRFENTKNISMTIDSLQTNDSGFYECYVKNKYSQARAVFEILVQNQPEQIETIFFDNSNRIFWEQPFDGNSKIFEYILRIRYKRGSSWSNETSITIENNEITSYSFENIFSKCLISVIIQAVNHIGSSLPSDPIYFQTTIQQLPIPPYNFTAGNISSTAVILTWQYPSIDICDESTVVFVIEITDRYNQTSTQSRNSRSRVATIKQLRSFTDYTIVIYARNEFGVSAKSEALEIQTMESVPLAVITDLTGRLLDSSTAVITWNFPQDDHPLLHGKFRTFAVTIYENFDMSTLKTMETMNTNVVLHNLHSSSRYFISVAICNHFDCGSSSSAIDIKTSIQVFGKSPVTIYPIDKPSSIQAKVHYTLSNEIGLKIIYPSEIIENVLIKYKIQNSSLIQQLDISPPVRNIRLTNLSCGNTYEMMIYANNQIGSSPAEHLVAKTEGSVPSLLESTDLLETISNDHIIVSMKNWLIDVCPILSYEIELFPLDNTSEIHFNRSLSTKTSIEITNLQSNEDYQLNIKIHTEAGDHFERISFRTTDDHRQTKIKNQHMIFLMICTASFLLTLLFLVMILKKTDLFNDQRTRLKPVSYSNRNRRSHHNSIEKNRSDSFASEDSQGNINPYAVTGYGLNEIDHCTTDIRSSTIPSQRYFCPIILESSSSPHQELHRQQHFLINPLSTVSSSADSGVHSSYTQSPRCTLHNTSTAQTNALYATYNQTRHHQYSLV